MHRAVVDPPWSLDAWRMQARAALMAGLEPASVDWSDDASPSLFAAPAVTELPPVRPRANVPRDFLPLAERVLAHRDDQRHALLYRLLWRLTHESPALLDRAVDPDVRRAEELAKAVGRDVHKMKAFVRFREVPGEADSFVAWFEPEHRIVDLAAPFFLRRFAGMRWAILTPYRSVRWDGEALAFGDGAARSDAPADDASEALWRAYYANIFNPARLNPRMMRQEMPQKYWKNLPEASLLPTLIAGAGERVRDMAERAPEAPRKRVPAPVPAAIPTDDSLAALRAAARDCRACPLWEPATQTVFGEGPEDARVMVIGEQPGDEEDLAGRPFVGPSGRLFDRALGELGLDRARFYVTNAVKHFKFERRGKFRLHRNPEASERAACRGWLEREIARIRPDTIVCLGGTAAEAVFGRGFKLMQQRGAWHAVGEGVRALATVHPSYVLRQRGDAERDAAWRMFVDDLALLREVAVGEQGDEVAARRVR